MVNAFGGVDYLPNRYLRLGVRYEFIDRASTPAAVQLRPAPGDAQCYSAVLIITPRSTASREPRTLPDRRSASTRPADRRAAQPAPQRQLIVVCLLVGTTLTIRRALSMTPQFKASVSIIVDPRRTQLLKDRDILGAPGPGTDIGVVESEAEVMRSPALMLRSRASLISSTTTNSPAPACSGRQGDPALAVAVLFSSPGEARSAFAVAERLSKPDRGQAPRADLPD